MDNYLFWWELWKAADSLENLIETNKETYDINNAKYLYRRAMELELDFFNTYSDF